jgi:hypothetical protein
MRLRLALALLLLAPVAALAADPPAAPVPPAPLPAGVEPLPPDVDHRIEELLHLAEKYRGLTSHRAVPAGALDEPTLGKTMGEEMSKEMPPARMSEVETVLKTLGLIPDKMDLAHFYPELLTTQVAGFYDPERKYLALVRREGSLLDPKAKDHDSERVEDMVLVHELTHALQDQEFDLDTFGKSDPLSDPDVARVALVEGDATLTMMSAMIGSPIEALPQSESMMAEMARHPEKVLEAAPDMPGSREIADAPAWFRDTLVFSYFQGFAFCVSVRKAGGQKLLDYAYRSDPPRSSEQILHPDKWLGRRDDPIGIPWPDLSAALPGWSQSAEAGLGELSMAILLRGKIRDRDRADAAAAGWGGDRLAVYEKAGKRLLVWITEWDTEGDAKEFREAARSLGRGWSAEDAGPRRVLVIRGDLPKPARAALHERVAAVVAEAPANRPIDRAAFGPPAVETTIAAEPEKDLDTRIAEMEQKLVGEIDEEGCSYSNEGLSFTIGLEKERCDGWTVQPGDDMALVTFLREGGRGLVNIGHQALPGEVPLESVVPFLSGMISKSMPDFRQLGEEFAERNGVRYWEMRFEATPKGGSKMRGIQRYYVRGGSIIITTGLIPAAKEKDEPAVRAFLDTLAFEPGAGETQKP